MKTILNALRNVESIIEQTYDHDEDGERLDEAGLASAADIVEMLCGIEGVIDDAIKEAEELPNILSALGEMITTDGAACWKSKDGMMRRLLAINRLAREAIENLYTPDKSKTV